MLELVPDWRADDACRAPIDLMQLAPQRAVRCIHTDLVGAS